MIQGSKYVWLTKEPDHNCITSIAARHNLSLPVAHTLHTRGYTSAEDIDSFLFTSDTHVHVPSLLKDARASVDRILHAIKHGEKILIFGDYDVDGVTSTALLLVSLLPLGANVNYYLPHREREGYGLSCAVVEKAKKSGYSLIVTVDNGISAYDAARKAKELGVDVIITDHHRPHAALPEAFSIVDPNQDGCEYPYKKLAGVGVAFKLMSLLYQLEQKTLPDKVYELLMLGTVADVVPLTEENRYWVRHGLYTVNAFRSHAMSVLTADSRLSGKDVNSLDVGFMIAPQINALGRLDDSREAVKFLISSDAAEVARVGSILRKMNEDRKAIERGIYDEIEGAIVNKVIDVDRENIIVASSATWPSGVIGLVAGRIMQHYGKPTFLFHERKDGTVRGSCRSIPEFDIFAALQKHKDLLLSFGGHAFAAGLSLKKDNVYELKQRLEDHVAAELAPEVLQPRIDIDAHCHLSDMNTKLMKDLSMLEPFGNSNKQPTFMCDDVTLLKQVRLLKDRHVKCSVFSQGVIKSVIFFNRPDLLPILNAMGDKPFAVAGNVTKNEWGGRVQIEMLGLDIALGADSQN